VFINQRPALRVDDVGIHAVCCGPNMWKAQQGAPTVIINGKAAFRLNDPSRHCGGQGQLIEGSSDVIIGDASSGGGGSGGGSSGASGSSSGSSGGSGGSGSGSGTAQTASGGGGAAGSSSGSGNNGSSSSSQSDKQTDPAAVSPDQIEIQIVNSAGTPRGGVKYELTLPDGSKKTGESDSQGWIRISGLTQSGDCQLVLPDFS
jgi:hypothetical protein